MKRVLIIGSDFVPSSLPPATRIRFFASHLSEFGWEPIVLTTKSEFYDWPTDPENERLLSDSLSVIRTDAWRTSWTRKLGVGDIGMRSLWKHWQVLKKLCREKQVDLIFIPVPPYVPMILGRMAHKKFGIPYVIDYIDPWVTEYYWKLPRRQRPPKWPLAYAMARLLEPYALKHVAHITGVSRGTTDSVVSRYDWLSENDASEIPYGAEADDFEFVRRNPRENLIFDPHDGLLHFSYIGACIPGMYPAVRALFQAVRLGLEHSPEIFKRVRFHFVGTSYAPKGDVVQGVTGIAQELGLSALVNEQSQRVPYLDSLQLMLDSDALLLIGSDEAHYSASKVFPYLLAQRPLVSIFHESSSVNAVLKAVGREDETVTFNADNPPPKRVEQIYRVMQRAFTRGPENNASDNLAMLEPYTTRSMAQRLAKSFDRACSRNSEMTGAMVPGEYQKLQKVGNNDGQQQPAEGISS